MTDHHTYLAEAMCEVCSGPFFPRKDGGGRFCSRKCTGISKRVPVAVRLMAGLSMAPEDDCWLWTGPVNNGGYGRLSHQGETRAHRISWIVHNGPIPTGKCVLHNCDVRYPVGDRTSRRCCNPRHLFLGTKAENNSDRDVKGRHVRLLGEAHGMAKLKDSDIIEIRSLTGVSNQKIAADRGLHPSTVMKIMSRKAWSHIE